MKRLYLHPIFLFGLVIKLALIICVLPAPLNNWYVPFLNATISYISLDPWSIWMNAGGTPVAFPYGYVMWLIFLPITIFFKLIDAPLRYGYNLTLLLADVCMLITLTQLLPDRRRLLLAAYWLSPIVILATYALGLNDIIPILLLIIALLFISKVKLKHAGAFCAAAISAKLSMVVAIPFFIIYIYNKKALRQRINHFLLLFISCSFIFDLPILISNSGLQMLFENPEMGKIYKIAINLGDNVMIYIVPLIYMIMVYQFWRLRRLNFDLFHSITGIVFLSIVLMMPASPGWLVWSIPFLVLYQAMSGRMAILLVGALSTLYTLSTLLASPVQFTNYAGLELSYELQIPELLGRHTASLLQTSMVAIGAVLAIRIWREAISRNDFFRLSRKPFVIGVAGDSGAGKDTFAQYITALFGEHSVVKISGDDYHFWDRQKPMWQVMTHLNPMANDLEGFCQDLISLVDGKSIQAKHYDHSTGKMSKPIRIKSNDFIIASGLHALYLPLLRNCYNLKIYLDIDEELRRHFKFKRDIEQRGHTLSRVLNNLEKREPDSEKFIRPQANYSDMIISLQPIHPSMLRDLVEKSPLRLKLIVKTKQGLNEIKLNRILVGVCGLHVDILVSDDSGEIQMTIEGDASAADIAIAAEILCPQVLEFLDISPKWEDGVGGLMQLITLSHISQSFSKRFIK